MSNILFVFWGNEVWRKNAFEIYWPLESWYEPISLIQLTLNYSYVQKLKYTAYEKYWNDNCERWKKTKNLTKKSTNRNQNSSSKKSNQNSGSLIVWIHIKNRLSKKVGVRKKTLKIIMQPLSRADRSCFRSLRTVGNFKNLKGAKIIFRLYLSVSVLFCRVHIFWEGHKILRNLHLTFDWHYIRQK